MKRTELRHRGFRKNVSVHDALRDPVAAPCALRSLRGARHCAGRRCRAGSPRGAAAAAVAGGGDEQRNGSAAGERIWCPGCRGLMVILQQR